MPTPTYIPLATVTLGSSASSVTFSSIPATFRDLVLVMNANLSNAADVFVRFNGDTGTNYFFVQMAGDGSVASSSSNNLSFAQISNSGSGEIMTVTQFMDYSATDKHKTFLSRQTNNPVRAWACRHANTAAISSIAVITSGVVTYAAGSTFSLYGIAS